MIFIGTSASAHSLNVFASVECDAAQVEATFSNGKPAVAGEIRLRGAANKLLATQEVDPNGNNRVPLDGIDLSSGLIIEVDTGGHDDYWIVTPDDIAQTCGG